MAQTFGPDRMIELCFADETSALDALHTLADGPVNILRPFSNAETG
jgi:hypothetical protein